MMNIDVCVATFKRPELLKNLLYSLAAQQLNGEVNLRVIIIDNDLKQSARTTVNQLRERLDYTILYDCEPERGISYARNRALSHVNGECFAFVDDDELVESEWLLSLLITMQEYSADVVFGPVIGEFPSDAPGWCTSQPSFVRPRKKTGSRVIFGATNNVLVKTASIGSPKLLFNNEFALTGGSDAEFFYQLHMQGRKMVWCDQAIVHEMIPVERLTTEWVYRRSFRGGQCYVRVVVARHSVLWRFARITIKSIQLILGLLILPIAYLASYPRYVRLRCYHNSTLGQLSVLLGGTRFFQEYDSLKYRVDKESK